MVQFWMLVMCSAVAGQGSGSPTRLETLKAEAFLKFSMDRYRQMPSFRADAIVVMVFGGLGSMGAPGQLRTILYKKPNRFKVVTNNNGFVQRSISNGTTLVEYSSMQSEAMSYTAPASIADADSMQMKHPMFCGTLLYQFFGGSANFSGLVNLDKGSVSFGGEETVQGEKSRVVKFYGQDSYGHVGILIGEKSGTVYRIRYDSEPLMKMMSNADLGATMKDELQKHADEAKPGPDKDQANLALGAVKSMRGIKISNSSTTESYTNIHTSISIPAGSFDVTIPKGSTVQAKGEAPSEKPPVPIGSLAPDFTVSTLDGRPIRLSSLRGHVVLLDFWATWCPPCRKGLPETERLAKLGSGQGLQVMAISNEDAATISGFWKENKYAMSAYRDAGDKAGAKYGIRAIPTTVIIDANGTLRAFFVGLHDAADIEAPLAKLGIKVSGP